MPPLRDSLWFIALVALAMAWWADRSVLASRLRNHQAAVAALQDELQLLKMATEGRPTATKTPLDQSGN